MLIPLALFLALLVATAFIAHWSDNLGKKLGKKRVSVLGLRPRHSATLLTVGSSWLIMGFTLGALLLVVKPLKDALFNFESQRASWAKDREVFGDERARFTQERQRFELEQQNSQQLLLTTQNQRKTAQNQANDANSKAKAAEAGYKKASAKVVSANQAKETAERGARTAQRAEQSARSGENAALATANIAKRNAETASNQARTANAQFQAVNITLGKRKTELLHAQSNLNEKLIEVKRLSGRVSYLGDQVRDRQQQVKARQFELFKQGGELVKTSSKLSKAQSQLSKAQSQLSNAQAQVAATQKEVDLLKKQQVDLTNQALTIATNANLLAYNDIALPFDQTLTEQMFPLRLSSEEAQSQLRNLLQRAREATRDFLKRNNNEALANDVEVVPLGISYDEEGKILPQSEQQWFKAVGDVIASSGKSVLARVVVANNYSSSTLKNSPIVEARLIFVRQDRLYNNGEVVSQGFVDGSKAEAGIYGGLTGLIEEARRSAVARGASPPLSPEAPTFFASDTGQQIFDALRQVQKAGHPVSVRVIAARELNAAEPLQIRFQIGDAATT